MQQHSHQQRLSAIVNMLILKAGHRLARRVVPAIVRASRKACNVTPKSPENDDPLTSDTGHQNRCLRV
jgi:hypothetical protein